MVVEHRPNTAAQRALLLGDQRGIVRGKWLIANNAVFPSDDILKGAREMTGKQ